MHARISSRTRMCGQRLRYAFSGLLPHQGPNPYYKELAFQTNHVVLVHARHFMDCHPNAMAIR
jgi:hypothetical protein